MQKKLRERVYKLGLRSVIALGEYEQWNDLLFAAGELVEGIILARKGLGRVRLGLALARLEVLLPQAKLMFGDLEKLENNASNLTDHMEAALVLDGEQLPGCTDEPADVYRERAQRLWENDCGEG